MALPYWIERGTNTVWTKVNIPANSSVVLSVKRNGTTQPNPDEVFLLFDDFEGNSLDTVKWISSGNVTVSNGILTVGDESYVYADFNLPEKLVIEAYITETSHTNYTGLGIFSNYNNVKPHFYKNGYGFGIYENYAPHWTYDSADASGNRHFLDRDYKEPLRITMKYDGTTAYWISELGEWRQTLNLDITGYKLKIASGDYSGSSYIKVDYIFIRKYADVEPTVQIEQVTSDEYRVKITNPNSYDLTDFQVGFKIDGISDSDKLDISYYIPEGKQITYDEVSNTIIIVGGTEDNPVSFTDLIIADDNNGWGVIDTDENGNYVIDATIQVGDDIAQTYFKTVNSTLLFTVHGTDYPLLNVKQDADCVLENTKIATLSQLDSIYEQLENIRNEISDVKTDVKNIDNTLSNLKIDLPESIKQMISYIFNAVKRLGI